MQHKPALLHEVIDILAPKEGESLCDATLGLGGHAQVFLKHIGPQGHLSGLDADEDNLHEAHKILSSWDSQVDLHHANFRNISKILKDPVDILFADLGLSSPHVDNPERGMSYREDAPLDMRYDRTKGETGADILMKLPEKEIADLFFVWGEVPRSRILAREIKIIPPKTTKQLRDIVSCVYGKHAKHMLSQIFQAVRIVVNDEMGALNVFLTEGPSLIRSGGRIGIISYHSLEDRMVKRAFKDLCISEKDPVTGQEISAQRFSPLTKKPIRPTDSEAQSNTRSRSARLRAIKKL